MIAEYESEDKPLLFDAPRQFGLTQTHKHLPEMKTLCNLNNAPVFCPIVSDYDRGMEVTVPLFRKDINGTVQDIKNVYKNLYNAYLDGNNMEARKNMLNASYLGGCAFTVSFMPQRIIAAPSEA